MRINNLHNWKLPPKEAIELQKKLAPKVNPAPVKKKPELVAGLDCAFSKPAGKIIAAVVVLKLHNLEVVETKNAVRELTFPYIPGLLSFREAPACIAAAEKLDATPDIFIIDGQGIAHPRRLGLAAHLGLFFEKPTIGCAKSRLIGTFKEPPTQKGKYSILKDKPDTIGAVLRTRTGIRPVFVSIGNMCTLHDAIKITLACTTRYRLPEPTRLAHQLVSKLKLKV